MKRYIEIIYDNSNSMNESLNGKTKYEIAQDLFEKEILPTIALKDDHIVLRLLRKQCESKRERPESLTVNYGVQRKEMLARIKRIEHDQSTPLFYTISDAIDACMGQTADEYLIFVLTDGDDTCGVSIDQLISQDVLNKYVKYYKILLVQLAIESNTSSNNLTALTNFLGGQTVTLGREDSTTEMRNKMKKALNVAGFSKKLPLQHCYENLPGFDLSWEDIEKQGIDFHQALLLFNRDLLSWQPNYDEHISTLRLAELKFLFGIYIKSSLPEVLAKTMMAQLKKPYYYSHDCIYWDFADARWKYFKQQNLVKQVYNPDAQNEDGLSNLNKNKMNIEQKEYYNNRQLYEVDYAPLNNISFQLLPIDDRENLNKPISLKRGDIVKFEG